MMRARNSIISYLWLPSLLRVLPLARPWFGRYHDSVMLNRRLTRIWEGR